MKKKIISFLLVLFLCISSLFIPNISTNAASSNIIAVTSGNYSWADIKNGDIMTFSCTFSAAARLDSDYGAIYLITTSSNPASMKATSRTGTINIYHITSYGGISNSSLTNLLTTIKAINGYMIPLSNFYNCIFIPDSTWNRIQNANKSILESAPYITTSGLGNLNNGDSTQINSIKNAIAKGNTSNSKITGNRQLTIANINGTSDIIATNMNGSGTLNSNYELSSSNLGDIIGHNEINGNVSFSGSTTNPSNGQIIKYDYSLSMSHIDIRSVLRAINKTTPVCNDTTKTKYYFFFGEKLIEESRTTKQIVKNPNNHSTKVVYTNVNTTTHKKSNVCTRCSKVVSETTESHSFDDGKVTKSPTCTVKGSKHYTCSICKGTKDEDIAPLGHDYSTVTIEATCEKDGEIDKICSRCHDKQVVKILNKLGHNWDAGTVTKEPTVQAEGVRTYTCTTCKKTKTESIPKLNPPTAKPTETQKPDTPSNSNNILNITIDANGLIDGVATKIFEKDGIKYNIIVNPDKSISVTYWDAKAKKWKVIPSQNNTNSSTTNNYNYVITTNPDGTKIITIKPTKLSKVKLTSFISANKKKAVVTYQSIKNAKKYQIQISTNKKFKKNVKKYTTKKTIYKFKKLKSKKTYYVRVRAYKKVNNKTVYGAWSKTKKVKVR